MKFKIIEMQFQINCPYISTLEKGREQREGERHTKTWIHT